MGKLLAITTLHPINHNQPCLVLCIIMCRSLLLPDGGYTDDKRSSLSPACLWDVKLPHGGITTSSSDYSICQLSGSALKKSVLATFVYLHLSLMPRPHYGYYLDPGKVEYTP